MRFYKRKLFGFETYQILIITDKNMFHSIFNEASEGRRATGACPLEFKEGEKVPVGFLLKYGFRRFYPSDRWLSWYEEEMRVRESIGGSTSGNMTDIWY